MIKKRQCLTYRFLACTPDVHSSINMFKINLIYVQIRNRYIQTVQFLKKLKTDC